MRKFLFLFLTMLCMLVSQGLNAQTLTITPRSGGYVDPTSGLDRVVISYDGGFEINTTASNGGYGSEWSYEIFSNGEGVGYIDYYPDDPLEQPTTDVSGNIIAYTFGILPEDGYDFTTLYDEGTYSVTIPAGLVTLTSGETKPSADSTITFTIGVADPFVLSSFKQHDLSIYGTEISVQCSYDSDADKVGGLVANKEKLEDVTVTTSDGNSNAKVTYLVENTNKYLLFTFNEALTPGTYTISLPKGYFDNEYYDMVSAKTDIEIVIPEGDDLGDLVYKTNFTDWESFTYDETNKSVTTTTEDNQSLTFSFNGFGSYPEGNQTRFSNYTGYLMSKKGNDGDEFYVETTALSSVSNIVFTEGATGSSRGITISVKGDVDEDWVSLYNTSITYGAGETDTIKVDRTNCQIRFGSLAPKQNAYLLELAIYGIEEDEEPASFEITLDPDGTEDVEEISEIKVTPAEGYTISGTTDDTTLAITLTATIEETPVSYTGTATVEEDGTATITFAADEEGNPITTDGTYTLTIPAGYFVTAEGATSEETTVIYTISATEEQPEPVSIGLLDVVEDNVFAITKDNDWYAANGFDGSEGSYYKLYDAGVIFYKNDNIKVETATETYVNTGTDKNQLGSIQAEHPTYTAYINLGSGLDEINEQTTDPTAKPGSWQGMLKVTPTTDGGLTFNVHAGGNTRTYGVYDVEDNTWVTIDNQVTGDVVVYAELKANKEYLLVAQGQNSNLYQIAFPSDEPVEVEPGPEQEAIVIYDTDFTDWPAYDAPIVTEDGELPSTDDGTTVTVTTTTDEEVTFTLVGVSVVPGDVTQYESDGTPKFEGEGALKFHKYTSEYPFGEPYVESTAISSVTKLTFTEAATAKNRGVKILVKGEDDEDWDEVYSTALSSYSEDVTVDINRENCQIRIENIALEQNAYILDLTIYGYGEVVETEPGPEEEEPVSGAITWVLDEGTANQPATYSLGTEDAYLSNSITLGSNLVYTGSTRTVTDGNENNETYDETVTFTTFNNLADEAETEAAQSNAIDFAVTMAEGYTFAPTEVSLYATRIGTDACNLNVTWVDSEGNETQMIATSASTGDNPGRANGTPNTFTKYTLDLSDYNIETIEDGTFTLRINVFNMAGGKTFGLANIVIKGQVSGVDIDDIYETLCEEIEGTDEYLETTWATIKADYPDAITEELESEYKEISEEIETLQANVDTSYEEGSLGEEVLDYEAQIASIKAEIDALLETALGINSITIESAGVKGIYTISGQKVVAPTKAGIYIIDGKKVVIK